MSGGSWGGSLNWAGHNHGLLAARAARRLAQKQIRDATEADLNERGIRIPEQHYPRSWLVVLAAALAAWGVVALVGCGLWRIVG